MRRMATGFTTIQIHQELSYALGMAAGRMRMSKSALLEVLVTPALANLMETLPEGASMAAGLAPFLAKWGAAFKGAGTEFTEEDHP